jgi:protocatechuate 3,4-dioxygenase beta subunit
VSFTSVFPACGSDRWPHINVEVFGSAGSAVAGENARLTSQIALPEAACKKRSGQRPTRHDDDRRRREDDRPSTRLIHVPPWAYA